jgi:hypothetical protein
MPEGGEAKRQVKVYLRPEEQAKLKELAAARGCTMSAVVTQLVADAKV